MNLQYKKAEKNNLDEIYKLIQSSVSAMESLKIFQWDSVYPDKKVIKKDIENGELQIGEICNRIVVIYVINKYCDDEYNNGNCLFPNSEYRVIHRLCVHPDFQNKGIGTITMKHIENELLKEDVESIRLDAFCKNPYALKLYKRLDYRTVGHANWRKGKFYFNGEIFKITNEEIL